MRRKISICPVKAFGFTLLELMVVLLILGMLAAIAAPQVMKRLDRAKAQTAQLQIDSLAAGIDYFKLDVGHLPSQEQGLRVLFEKPTNTFNWDGPYIKKESSLIDPWGRHYLYRRPGKHGEFDIISLGADGKEGGDGNDQDLDNW